MSASLIFAWLLAAAPAASENPACTAGALAMRDLKRVKGAPWGEKFYGSRSDQAAMDILSFCPELASQLPKGMKLARPAQVDQMNFGMAKKGVSIYRMDAPVFNMDGSRATFRMECACGVFCGSSWEVTYRRDGVGWTRAERTRYVGGN